MLRESLGTYFPRSITFRYQYDSQVGIYNRTFQQMTKTLVSEAKDDYHDMLPYVSMAHCFTVHESTV